MNKENDSSDVCCSKFDPTPYQNREIVWNNKLFIQESIPQFMHMPFPSIFGATIKRMWNKIEKANAKVDIKDFLMLSYDPSPWKSELYINVTKEISDAKNVKLSGTFLTKVFDGPFNAVPKWIVEMDKYVQSKGEKVQKYYFYYTTCPKCAQKFGHNYVVIFAQIN